MIWHYMKKNLYELFRERKLFLYLFLVQAICCLSLLFAYGAFRDYELTQAEEKANLSYGITFDGSVTGADFLPAFEEILECMHGKAKEVYIMGDEKSDSHYLEAVFSVSENGYTDSDVYMAGNVTVASGRFLTDEEQNSERYVAYVSEMLSGQSEISFGTDTWEIVGYDKCFTDYDTEESEQSFNAIVPVETLKNRVLFACTIEVSLLLSEREQKTVTEVLDRYISGRYIATQIDYEASAESKSTQVCMLVIILIAALSAMNTVLIYSYLLKKRSRLVEILRFNGARRGKIRAMYFGEVAIFTFGSACLTLLIFRFAFLGLLSEWYLYFPDIYYGSMYLKLLAVYIAVTVGGSVLSLWRPLSKY